jgi:hypothetical protein
VNDQQSVVLELDCHHLQRDSFLVIAEKDESQTGFLRGLGGWVLLEAQAAMLDDVAGAFTRYPMLGGGASPSQIHGCNLLILSDNISTIVFPTALRKFRALLATSARLPSYRRISVHIRSRMPRQKELTNR